MSDDGARVIVDIEGFNQERFVVYAVLDGFRNLCEDLFGGFDKYFVQMFLLADLIKQRAQRLDPQ
jgi:hypothetical protein